MIRLQKVSSIIVLVLAAGGYVPVALGACQHPSELNVAAFGLWTILSIMFVSSSLSLGFVSWRLPLGFLIGNVALLVLAIFLRDVTFNLGQSEWIALFGTIVTLSVWVTHGHITKKRNPRILLWGAVCADVLSCYPMLKQYLYDAHAPMTMLGITGWTMWYAGILVNLIGVDMLPQKLAMSAATYKKMFGEEKHCGFIAEESVFSIEQTVLVPLIIVAMV